MYGGRPAVRGRRGGDDQLARLIFHNARQRGHIQPGQIAGRLADLAATTVEHQVWVITDDLEDPDTATTILWPSDY